MISESNSKKLIDQAIKILVEKLGTNGANTFINLIRERTTIFSTSKKNDKGLLEKIFSNFRTKENLYIVKIEIPKCSIYYLLNKSPLDKNLTKLMSFDVDNFLQDRNGKRLIEEVSRRLSLAIQDKPHPDLIVFSTPGTIRNYETIGRSSRLGIYEPTNIADYFKEKFKSNVVVLRDSDALAFGELYFGNHPGAEKVVNENLDFALIIADQGVGMTLVQKGKVTKGAGVAGAIGRIVVEPNGHFNKDFGQRGNLETFASIPWISNNIIEEYLQVKDNLSPHTIINREIAMQIKAGLDKNNWKCLDIDTIAQALKEKDIIVYPVIYRAAQKLSTIINTLIAINNPSLIILAGGLFERSELFFQMVVSETQRLSWGAAWKNTTISRVIGELNTEVLGAAFLGLKYHKEITNDH